MIYYHLNTDDHIRFMYIYKKGKKDNISEQEKALLRKINETW